MINPLILTKAQNEVFGGLLSRLVVFGSVAKPCWAESKSKNATIVVK